MAFTNCCTELLVYYGRVVASHESRFSYNDSRHLVIVSKERTRKIIVETQNIR